MSIAKSAFLTASGLFLTSSFYAVANDYNIDVSQNTQLHPGEASVIQIDISKLTNTDARADSFYLSLTKAFPSSADPAFENWNITSPFGDCRFTHENEITLMQQAKGSRFACENIDVLNQTGSASLTLNLTPDELTHYNLVVAVGGGSAFETLIVNPKLDDSDGDGALDQEERMAGSDKNDPNSLPSQSNIKLLLLYTQDIVDLYPGPALADFFTGIETYVNKTFADSGVNIGIEIVSQEYISLDFGTPPYDDKLARLTVDMENRKNGFEGLAKLNQQYNPNIIGLIAAPISMDARGRASAMPVGRRQGHFWSVDDYQVIAHEIGHLLGSDHDYDNSYYVTENAVVGAYNFSFGYIEPTSGTGTLMSTAVQKASVFSNTKSENCPLSSCGTLSLEPGMGASAVDTFNLRRFFISEAKETDSDLDGVSNWFVDKYLMVDASPTSPYRCWDYDGDGYPNISEFKALTDPTSADSKPEQANIAADCPAPNEKIFQIATAKNQAVELDLRQYTDDGYLIYVYPEVEGSIGGLSWDIYRSGLYKYVPEADFTGNAKLAFIADNGIGGKVKNTVYVKVGMENSAPIADLPSTMEIVLGQPVSIDGSQSQDPDGDDIGYSWKLTQKPDNSLLDNNLGVLDNVNFTPDVVGIYSVELTVSDGALTSSVQTNVEVQAQNRTPVASISGQSSIELGQMATLDGSQSQDPDGDTLTYQWKITTKPASSQTASELGTAASASFKPDVSGQYTVELTVSDASLTAHTEFSINVKDKPVPPPPAESQSSGGGGSLSWLTLALLMLARLRKAGVAK
ncbi:PKD domain-containing protein [Shewanella sp. FJAT-52076]|uniref:PKD domain-containing protein n=1 Tax=Shewanella sp. FJAT-52076 TaxID=2864202 RepID=UPI001C65B455|nr:PKD domain-containing protein [Shewanella sp. FJAT-52076]QYJ74665.1 GlyGly-CTERM sorting domain-containing protein [Shewanella sp. FJAT-52076]